MTAFSEQEIKLSSGVLRYRKGGSGRPILTLHGTGGPNVSPMMEELAQRHTIYQPVGPGWDGTPMHPTVKSVPKLADLYAEFIRTAVGGPCDVDRGLVRRLGRAVARLAPPGAGRSARARGAGGPARPGYRRPARRSRETARRIVCQSRTRAEAVRSPEVWAQNRRTREGYAAGISLDQPLLEALPRIKARTLALFGTKDEVCPVEKTGRRLKAGIPHCHLSFIYGAAHALELDQPTRVARLIGAFLERGEAFLVRNPEAA